MSRSIRTSWVVAAVVILGGCDFLVPSDECSPNAALCEGNTAKTCYEQDFGDDSYWAWGELECNPDTQCQVGNSGTLALCAYGPPNAACDEDGFVCDGNELLSCNGGYVVSWQHCVSCATNGSECTEFGWDATECCRGKMGDRCEHDDDCVNGLLCISDQGSHWPNTCSLFCDRPESDWECPQCSHTTSSRPTSCHRGVCI